MIQEDKKYAIVIIEDEKGQGYVYHGKVKSINYIFYKSDAFFKIVEVKYFNNMGDLQSMLKIVKEDFTGDDILPDVIIYECDSYLLEQGVNIEKMVFIHDLNKTTYKILHDWFKAKNEVNRNIIKDEEGRYYFTKGISLFNPEKIYVTETDMKQYHKKSYLQIKFNETKKDKNNWIIKEIITEKEFSNRCNFLDRLGGIV